MLVLGNDFQTLCYSHKVEPIVLEGDRVLFLCPKTPSDEEQQVICTGLPAGTSYKFMESLSTRSLQGMNTVLGTIKGMAADPSLKSDDHKITLDLKVTEPAVYQVPGLIGWLVIREVLVRDEYVNSFEIKVNDQTVMTWDRNTSTTEG